MIQSGWIGSVDFDRLPTITGTYLPIRSKPKSNGLQDLLVLGTE
jgi:hypothetical protein